jgi:uncharacterized membrane protein YraQ (UPF0718 family)
MALIYTIIINLIVDTLGYAFISLGTNIGTIGEWTTEIKMVWSLLIAVIIGILMTYLYNNDTLYDVLRTFKITNRTSYPSEWYGTFSETQAYVVLHFIDGKRLMGWPQEWPVNPKNGHFILEDASWLIEDGRKQIELSTVSKIMVDTTKIDMVEFLKENKEKTDES